MNRKENPSKGTFKRDPYSGRAQALFTVMFEPLCMDESWQNFFFILELTRLSLGFSMAREINQADTNRQGNQAYMRILSLSSFKSMFQNMIPPIILDPTPKSSPNTSLFPFTEMSPLDLVCQYIYEGFVDEFQARIPFWHLDTEQTLQNVCYMQVDTTLGNPSLVQFYRDKASISDIVSGILLPSRDIHQYCEVLQKDVDILLGDRKDSHTNAAVNQMINNMKTYDLMSPVPFSLPTDIMGYNTRYFVPGTPRFLLKVKYVQRFYEENEGDTKCLYNQDFKEWTISEFEKACNNWVKKL